MEEEKRSAEIADIGAVNSHDHLCLLYQDDPEVLNLVLPFIQKGVAIGERCVYLHAAAQKLERLLQNIVDAQKQDGGALILLPVKQTWLRGGTFKQERVMELLRNICAGAAAEGFSGTRIICDMGWAVKDERSLELLHRFERDLTVFASEQDTALLCLYDRRLFNPELLLELARMHPGLVSGGKVCENPLFIPRGFSRARRRRYASLTYSWPHRSAWPWWRRKAGGSNRNSSRPTRPWRARSTRTGRKRTPCGPANRRSTRRTRLSLPTAGVCRPSCSTSPWS
ncbi:MEDS domain-containing protein [Geomonas subterranea]|uniref:MEDS domain-containing protein n=1 Tax=Geomonas subterranea TaxID=2847989 RepID=UPI001EF06D19|nr:MEDS domain-containing protein [Geomonas subterranea]